MREGAQVTEGPKVVCGVELNLSLSLELTLKGDRLVVRMVRERSNSNCHSVLKSIQRKATAKAKGYRPIPGRR